MTGRRIPIAALIVVLVLVAGCTDGDGSTSTSSSVAAVGSGDSIARDESIGSPDSEPDAPESSEPLTSDTPIADTTAPTTPTSASANVEPIPPLPDPAPALACDGLAVLCVDISMAAAASDGSAAQPFGSVSEALAAASSNVTIQVAAGVYDEPLVLTEVQSLRLIGGFVAAGDFSQRDPAANETTIVGDSDSSVIELVASNGVHIEGFRLTGGGGRTDTYNWYGGGIYVDEASANVAIVGNRIEGNAIDQGGDPGYSVGGGIATYGDAVSIIGNVVDDNRAGRGAGIGAIGVTTIERNVVRNNVAVGDHGGGLYLAGDVTVTANHIEGNRVGVDYGWGGGILVFNDGTAATLRANVVTDNLAYSAGSGVFVDDGADATLIGELYYANACTVDGGNGLFVDSGGQTLTIVSVINVTIAQHDCPNSSLGGNAILAEISEASHAPPEVSITNSIFWGNAGSDVVSAGASIAVTYSLAEQAIDGEGNISADPLFVDPASGDFHLLDGSPAIDAGDPASAYDAEPDPNGARVDVGYTGNTPEAGS